MLLACVAACGVAVLGASAPDPAESPAPLIERVTTELVLIEVYVSDPDGRPVPGLTADDFVLEVDGHRKPIASAEAHTMTPAGAPPGASPSAEGGMAASSSSPPPGAAGWPRRFVLFFEDDTSATEGMTNARRASERFLGSGLAPSDQVAVVSYDRHLKVLHDFTTDREALRRAIDHSLDDTARYSDFAAEETEVLEELRRNRYPSPDHMATVATRICLEQKRRFEGVLNALESLVDSLAPWRGHKGIVFIGEGVPDTPTGDLFDELLKKYGPDAAEGASRCSMVDELKRLNVTAAAAGVALNSIQSSGLTAETGHAAYRTSRRANALRTLALNSGGLASDSNDITAALGRVEEASRSYYVLGYAPEGPPDGRYHSVVVRCRRRHTRLRWRHGFTRLPPAEARERSIQAAHLLPELFDELGVEGVTVAGPRSGNERAVDLVLHVPAGRLLFLPESGRPTARLEVGFVGIDASLRQTMRISRRLKVALPEGAGPPRSLSVTLYTRCRLPVGSQSVTAVVYDDLGGSVGGERLEIPAAPQPPPAEGTPVVVGLSLHSLSEASMWVEVPAAAAAPAEGGAEAEAAGEIGPALKGAFDPAEEVACGFRLGAGAGSGDASLRLEIRRGDEVVRERPVDPSAAGRSVKIELPTAGLPSGRYDLVVLETAAAPLEVARAPFEIH